MSGEKNNNSTVLAFASAITSKINGLISSHNSNTSAHSDKESVSNKVTSWSSPTSNNKYASEKLVKDSLDNKQDTLVSGTSIKTINNESLLGSGNLTIESNSGSNVIDYYWDPTTEEVILVYGSGGGSSGGGSIDIDSTWIANSTNPVESQLIQTALNAKQDTLVSGTSVKTINNQSLLGSGNITVLTSHQSLADCLQKSQTAGLVKNDGTIDENSYALTSHNHSGTYANATHTHTQSQITDLSTIPTASSTTPSADTTAGSYGSGTSYARSNHTHPKSTLYAEASHTHSTYVNPTIADNLTTDSSSQVLSAKQGKVLNDKIGNIIQIINGTGS